MKLSRKAVIDAVDTAVGDSYSVKKDYQEPRKFVQAVLRLAPAGLLHVGLWSLLRQMVLFLLVTLLLQVF